MIDVYNIACKATEYSYYNSIDGWQPYQAFIYLFFFLFVYHAQKSKADTSVPNDRLCLLGNVF